MMLNILRMGNLKNCTGNKLPPLVESSTLLYFSNIFKPFPRHYVWGLYCASPTFLYINWCTIGDVVSKKIDYLYFPGPLLAPNLGSVDLETQANFFLIRSERETNPHLPGLQACMLATVLL